MRASVSSFCDREGRRKEVPISLYWAKELNIKIIVNQSRDLAEMVKNIKGVIAIKIWEYVP